MSSFKKHYGQSTAEYVIVLGLIVGAVLAMQVYVKRGLQGRIREVTDTVDNVYSASEREGAWIPTFTAGRQYEPYYAESKVTQSRQSDERQKMTKGGEVEKTFGEQGRIIIQEQGSYQKINAPEDQD